MGQRSGKTKSPHSMFILSKLLSFACQPLSWVLVLLLGGLLAGMRSQRRLGAMMCWTALGVLLLTGWSLPADAVLRELENQHAAIGAAANLSNYAGVVVLGGALASGYIWTAHDQIALTDAAERMIVPVALARQYPHLRLLFTGGEGELFSTGPSEAQRAKILFDQLGVPVQQVLYESASRTTYENAVFSTAISGVNPAAPWLLLTSAYHMPRAMETFRKAGWNVTAYPVDFHTGSTTSWHDYSLEKGARKWYLALHELTGLWAYRLSGKA